MPELPEVQTIIDDLNKKIKGETIAGFWTDWKKTIKNINEKNPASSADEFSKKIQNRKILGVRRIGKNIFIDLSGGKTIYIHLKMTGHLLVKPHPNPLLSKERGKKENLLCNKERGKKENLLLNNKEKVSRYSETDEVNYFSDRVNQYVHHIWKLKSGHTLEFSDLRKFGKIVLLDTNKVSEYKDIKNLGVDAMSPKFTFTKFNEILEKRKKTPIGLVLMDQNLIAGVGNIYRSEILFDAGILPQIKIGAINREARKKIYSSIGKILKKAIKYRGTSDSDYRDTAGAPGGYQNISMVYRKEKQKCRRCGTIIKRETLGQRSVFFCAKCQK